MIYFYDKETGKIVGTIEGRIHSEAHLKMWIGDRNKTERVIVPWKVEKKEEVEREVNVKAPVTDKDIDEKKKVYKDYVKIDYSWDDPRPYKLIKKKKKMLRNIWKPDSQQADLFQDFDRRRKRIKDYRFDLKTKKLVKRTDKIETVNEIIGFDKK